MIDTSHLLNDEQMQHFLSKGYLPLKSSLPAEFHQKIYDRTTEVMERDGNPGNNILPQVPEIQKIFSDPIVQGAVSSVVGPAYTMHSHRHCHINPPNSDGGGWHKDSYWGYQKIRPHRCRWAMIFYYPQDTPFEQGPTGVIGGTHVLEKRVADESQEDQTPVCGEAGTMALVHFDLWHRAYPNQTDKMRYMMKFQFTRMAEPEGSAWNGGQGTWAGDGANANIGSALWDWNRGVRPPQQDLGNSIEQLAQDLRHEAESQRLNAAYTLGSGGQAALAPLLEALRHDTDETCLAAAYGLGLLNQTAVAALIDATQDATAKVRAHAAFALGDMGAAAADAGVEALVLLVNDPDETVRRVIPEALGNILQHPQTAVPALIRLLQDEDAQTRYEAAYGLARFGNASAAAFPALEAALADENRYVRNHSAEALKAIGTAAAIKALMDYLAVVRWCPMTHKQSTF